LLESAGDGFVFALVKYFDKILDGFARGVELASTVNQLLTALGEVFVLLESFLVDILELLQGLVDLLEFAGELHHISLSSSIFV
jgi:hypothetical protein